MNRYRLWRDAPSVHLHPAVNACSPLGNTRSATPHQHNQSLVASHATANHPPARDDVIQELGGDPLVTALRTLYTLLGAPDQLLGPASLGPASLGPASLGPASKEPACIELASLTPGCLTAEQAQRAAQ